MKIGRLDELVEEVKRQLRLAVPLFSVGILQFILQTISVMFVGHFGTLPLSGAFMANSFASVTGFNLVLGLATALDTFCGQSNGAGQYHMLGIHLQRSMLVILMVSVIVAIIWANTETILIALDQDKAISKEAGSYARYMIPSLFAYGLLQSILKFLQNQKIVFPMVLTSGITAAFHVLFCWVLVFKSRLGHRGAALAISISYWVNAILISLYVRFSSSCKQTWTGFSKMALHNLLDFLKLAFPSAIMLCLKVWTFELMILLSGLLPNPALETSVLSICLNTFCLAWMIPYGYSAAVSVRVSNELGKGNPEAASVAVRVVLVIGVIERIVMFSVLILVRNVWGHIYSNDKQVIRYVSVMMPVLAASSFLDGIQGALSGILAGCGWQKIGAYVNLASFYLVGVPIAVVLAFVVHMKAKGLWVGIISAFTVQVLLFVVIIFRTNWEDQAKKAKSRVERTTISLTTGDSVLPNQERELVP